jgi:hypothetical protein
LLKLLLILVDTSLIALVCRHVGPVLVLSNLLLGKVLEALHQLVDAEQGRALVDGLPEDL